MENSGSIFTSVLKKRQKRSTFNLSHDVKMSLDMGYLCPMYLQECVPGDKIKINTTQMLRMAPLISPVMHRINVHVEYFFVPNRILWKNWETFITGSRNGKQLSAEEMPAFPIVRPYNDATFLNGNGTLMDYMGLPTKTQFSGTGQVAPSGLTAVSALPFAAYQRIYDEYYRDENLIDSMYDVDDPSPWDSYNMLPDGDQPDAIEQQLSTIRIRCWEHDYFTSALPWAQKGEQVSIPIDFDSLSIGFDENAGYTWIEQKSGAALPSSPNNILQNQWGSTKSYIKFGDKDGANVSASQASIDNSEQLFVDGSAGGTTINDLRAAIKLQEWLETNARGGTRYFESIYAHFGVQSPDSRLQRPEFIGSSRSSMVISEVLQTSSPQTDTDTPQGNMSGHGSNVSTGRNFKYFAQEHGYIIGIISVMPKTAYMQGIQKHFLKFNDRLEYYFPEFAHLGEQEITNQEIYAGSDSNSYDPLATFGYVPRYSEYKFINSRVAGDFRDTLKYWHLGRDFSTGPNLNDIFVGADPSKRIFAVQDIPQSGDTDPADSVRDYHSIYAHVFHDVKATRLMPKYGTPTI